MSIFGIIFFPFRIFGRRKSGTQRTVAEQRRDDTAKMAAVASQIQNLQSQVVRLEKNIPYIKNDAKRRRLDIQKLKIEQRIRELERNHHALANRTKG